VDIAEACKTVYRWHDLIEPESAIARDVPCCLPEAVAEVKRYLELEETEGEPISELEITEELLMTREGVQWVMPFALLAESVEAWKHRKTPG
jgi:hypothetical protein